MKKANKKIYNQASKLYTRIRYRLQPDNDALVTKLNNLLQEYDFNNEIFNEDGKQGLALCTGEVIIPAKYQRLKLVSRFSLPREEIMAIGVDEEGECLINHRGEIVFAADKISPQCGAFIPFAFKLGYRWGVCGANSKIIIPPSFDKIEWAGNGFIFFKQDGKYGLRTPFGQMIAPQFDTIGWDSDDYLTVEFEGKKGYLDENNAFTSDKSEAYYTFQIAL